MQFVDLNEISIFVKVVQAGSFTKASKQLGIPISTTSARVASLERRLGVMLLQRTTRQLKITDFGKDYYEQCLRGLEEIYQAENEISSGQSEPQGNLKITAPIFLGSNLLPSVIKECLKKYPKINLEIILTDRSIDLIAERIDLAIRAGDLKDSTLIAKKIGETHFSPYASPAYLKTHGTPKHPKDLKDHTCILFSPLNRNEWCFTNGKTRVNVPLKENLLIDDLNTIKTLALDGCGIVLLPSFVCDKDEKKNKLVQVLTDWKSLTRSLYFVYPPQRFPSPKHKAFMEIAKAYIEAQLKTREH